MCPVGLRKPPKTGWTHSVFRTETWVFSPFKSGIERRGKTAISSENCIGWSSCLSSLASLHVKVMDKIGSGIMTNAGHYNIIIQHYDSILSNYLLKCSQWIVLPPRRWMSWTQTINWVEIIKIRHLMPQKINHKKEFTSAAACDYECSTLFFKFQTVDKIFILSNFWLLATKIQLVKTNPTNVQSISYSILNCLNV